MLGELSALFAAIVWAVATWLYGRFSHEFSALQLNVLKGLIASGLMLVSLALLPTANLDIDPKYFWILAVSGVIGIAIGDSAYFASLKRIGANKTLLLESLAPPLTGILALLVLNLPLSPYAWLAVIVTTLGVTMAVMQKDALQPNFTWSGIGFGLLASICQATGVIISHYALVAADIEPLVGALLRLSAGVLVVGLWLQFSTKQVWLRMWATGRKMPKADKISLFFAIFIGTFLALWLQQYAVKHANPAVAQTLIATSPIFMLCIYWFKGVALTKRSVIASIIAVLGVSLFFFSGGSH